MVRLRKSSLRWCIVIALVALLCAGLFFFGGNALAPLVTLFALVAWLLAVVCASSPGSSQRVTDPAIEQTPSRAPPTFSF